MKTKTLKDNNTVPSLKELMAEAYIVSLKLCYKELDPSGVCFTPRSEILGTQENDDMIWAWADGLNHKYYQDRATGHCSLKATIDFDIGIFEDEVKADIATMKRLLKKFGNPIILTKEEMIKRGYTHE